MQQDNPRHKQAFTQEAERRLNIGGESADDSTLFSLRAAARACIPDEADSMFWYPSLHWYAVAGLRVCARVQLPIAPGLELEKYHAIPYVLARDETWIEIAIPAEQDELFKDPAHKPRFFIKRVEADNE